MTLQFGLCPAPLPGADTPPARSQLPASQPERLKMLELLQQIPIKVGALPNIPVASIKGVKRHW